MKNKRFFRWIEMEKGKPFTQLLSRYALSLVIVASLLAGLVGAVGLPAAVSSAVAQNQGEETANYLPPDTYLYFTINFDLEEEHLDNFWRVVNNWWGDPNIQAKLGELMDEFDEGTGIDIENDILPWLGPEIAIGARDIVIGQYPLMTEFTGFIGTMDKMASDAAFEKYMTWRVEGEAYEYEDGDYYYEKGLTYSSTDYRGQAIVIGEYWWESSYSPREIYDYKEYYGFTDEYIVVSNSEAALHDAIDLILDGGESLADTANFKAAQAALPERAGMFYWNVGELLDDFAQLVLEEEPGISQQLVQDIVDSCSELVPSYLAASLKFDGTGITGTGYFPIPEGVTFPTTEAAQIKATDIVPGDALAFVSMDMNTSWIAAKSYAEAVWEQFMLLIADPTSEVIDEIIALVNEEMGLDVGLEEIWADDIAPQLEELAGMTPEDFVEYISETISEIYGIDLEQLWADMVAPLLDELADKSSLSEAITYIDETFELDLEETWEEIAPNLGELSGMTLEQAITRLSEALGLDETWEAEIAPYLEELSGMSYQEAIVSVLNLEEHWVDITTHLDALSSLDLTDAIKYCLTEIVTEALEEAMAQLDEALSGVLGESAIALLPLSSIEEVPDILLISEVSDISKAQEELDTLMEMITLLTPAQISEQSIDGVTATIIEDEAFDEIGISPGYLFLDVDGTDYLVFGSTIDSLEAAVNAKNDPAESLTQAEEYEGLLFQLGEIRGSLIYLNITGMLDTVVSEAEAELDWFADYIPLKSALGYTYPILGDEGITMTGALYILPPPLAEQEIEEGFSGTKSIPEKTFDLSSVDPDVGQAAVQIDVDIIDAPAGASIQVTAMDEIPADVNHDFELAATDADLNIVDIAYVVRVDKVNITTDNMGTATITLKVGKAWVDEYGEDNVRIFRIGDDGTREVLPTEFIGYVGDQAVFEAVSENGLSYFGLAAVSSADDDGGISLFVIGAIVVGVVVVVVIVALAWRLGRRRPYGAR